ncbi:MAG: hypothetical protein ACYDAO_09400 [Thermoplasmataceae archaeon]
MEIVETIKEHPYVSGGAALLMLVVFMRGGPNSSSSGMDPIAASLQSQSIATQGDIAISQTNAALSAKQASTASANYIASLAANSANNNSNNTTAAKILASVFAHADTQTALDNQLQIQASTISAGHDIALQSLSAQLQALTTQSSTQLHLAELNKNSLFDLATLSSQRDQNMLNLTSQRDQNIANTVGANSVAMALINEPNRNSGGMFSGGFLNNNGKLSIL